MPEKNKPDRKRFRDDKERLETYLENIKDDADAVRTVRDQADSDMRFLFVDGGQWEGELNDNWQANRVRLQIDMVSDWVFNYIGGWDEKRLGVKYKPDDTTTREEDCTALNSLYRTDYLKYGGELAIDTAVAECSVCGYGALKLAPIFEDDEDPENESMRVEFRPIYNAYNHIFWDISSQRPDKLDANHVTQLDQYTQKGFKKAFPGFQPSSAYDPRNYFFSTSSSTDLTDFVLVGNRYDVVKKRTSVFMYNNLQSGEIEVYDEDAHEREQPRLRELREQGIVEFVRERKIVQRTIEKTVFSGLDILKPPQRIAGKRLPIVPFYGIRNYVDGAEWYRGLTRKFKDPQRLYNMQMSQVAENSGQNNGSKPIFDPDQMESDDIKDVWANKNNKPYLLAYALRDDDGNVIHAGPIGTLEPSQMEPAAAAILQTIPQYMQQSTGSAPTETVNHSKSGEHSKQLAKREERKTKIMEKGIKRAIQLTGVVYQEMAPEVYSERRRIQTMDFDGEQGELELFETSMDEKTGTLVESNKIGGRKFQCYSDIGQMADTESEEVVETMKGAMEALKGSPVEAEYVPVLMSTMIDNLHGAGYENIKKLNRRKMLLMGLEEPDNDEEKQFLAQVAQQQNQPDPQQKLIEAAAQQQLSEARNLDAETQKDLADADKKHAEIIDIFANIPLEKQRIANERAKIALQSQQKAVTEQAKTLPLA